MLFKLQDKDFSLGYYGSFFNGFRQSDYLNQQAIFFQPDTFFVGATVPYLVMDREKILSLEYINFSLPFERYEKAEGLETSLQRMAQSIQPEVLMDPLSVIETGTIDEAQSCDVQHIFARRYSDQEYPTLKMFSEGMLGEAVTILHQRFYKNLMNSGLNRKMAVLLNEGIHADTMKAASYAVKNLGLQPEWLVLKHGDQNVQ